MLVTEDARTAFAPICCGSIGDLMRSHSRAGKEASSIGSTSATLPGSIIFCFIRWPGRIKTEDMISVDLGRRYVSALTISMAIRPRGIMAGAIETSRGDRTGVEAIRGDAMALEVADRVGQSLSNLG